MPGILGGDGAFCHPASVAGMSDIVLAVWPVFAIITLGPDLRRGGIPPEELQALNDRLVCRVPTSALPHVQISTADRGDRAARELTILPRSAWVRLRCL